MDRLTELKMCIPYKDDFYTAFSKLNIKRLNDNEKNELVSYIQTHVVNNYGPDLDKKDILRLNKYVATIKKLHVRHVDFSENRNTLKSMKKAKKNLDSLVAGYYPRSKTKMFLVGTFSGIAGAGAYFAATHYDQIASWVNSVYHTMSHLF